MGKIEISYQTVEPDDLTPVEKSLLDSAIEVLPFSHSPYSKFKVGCSVLMEDQTIVSGTNQENAAYPSGLCAERVALFAAKGSSKKKIETILVIARNQKGSPADAFSCGNCRQVMLEYASLQSTPIKILLGTREGNFHVVSDVKVLLPFHFDAGTLG